MHKAPHRGDAFEVVEVRGWVKWVAPFANLDDPDFHYYIELDPDNPPRQLSGPRAGEIVPLPLILHPGNLIEPDDFSGAPRRQFEHRDNRDVFVGNILKVEIHGCATGGRQDDAPRRVLCSASTNDPQTVPADWVAADDVEVSPDYPDGRSDIWWPFHPRRPLDFQPGEIREGGTMFAWWGHSGKTIRMTTAAAGTATTKADKRGSSFIPSISWPSLMISLRILPRIPPR